MNKVLKIATISSGVFFVIMLLLLAGSIHYGTYLRKADRDEVVKIKSLEKKNQGSSILDRLNNHKNPTDYLIQNFQNFSEEESRLIISWLLNREKEGKLPYYYFASLYFLKIKDAINGAKYFMLAKLVSRIDAARCGDQASSQAYMLLEGLFFSSVEKNLKMNSNLYVISKTWALDYEDNIIDRSKAAWICSHGISSFTNNRAVVSDKEWREKRKNIRVKFLKQAIYKQFSPNKSSMDVDAQKRADQ